MVQEAWAWRTAALSPASSGIFSACSRIKHGAATGQWIFKAGFLEPGASSRNKTGGGRVSPAPPPPTKDSLPFKILPAEVKHWATVQTAVPYKVSYGKVPLLRNM